MRTRARLLSAAVIFALAAGALAPVPAARAETRNAATVTLGWQSENADAILVGTVLSASRDAASPERTIDVRVDRVLAGTPAAGSTVRVTCEDHGAGAAWTDGTQVLVFLRRVPSGAATETWVPLSGAFSLRALPAGSAEARFPALVTSLRKALDAKDPALLRALLVTWMDDTDAGVAWSAATDFVRHEELHAALTDGERARIVDAYTRQPIGKNTKDALAFAVAVTGSPAAAPALVDSLLLPGAGRIRATVAEALRRIGSPETESLVIARLRDAKPEQQESLLAALAVVGGSAAAREIRPLLESATAAVRVGALSALGNAARNVRAADPTARLNLAETLAGRLPGRSHATDAPPPTTDEIRATLWALAQLDEPAAYDALRTFAAEGDPIDLRDYAARLVARPRQSLVLRAVGN